MVAVLSDGFTIGVGNLVAWADCEHVTFQQRHMKAASFQTPEKLETMEATGLIHDILSNLIDINHATVMTFLQNVRA